MLQTFVDLRSMLASVQRVRATLSQLPLDESMVQSLPPLPDTPWLAAAAAPGAPAANGSAAVPFQGLQGEQRATAAAAGSGSGANGSVHSAGGAAAAEANPAVEAAVSGDIRLEGVSFAYPVRPGAPVLRDLCLTLPRGKVTAVVGRCAAAWGGGREGGEGIAGAWLLRGTCAATRIDAAGPRHACFRQASRALLLVCPVITLIDICARPSPLARLPARSGAGKSTMAALLERLYSPDAGSITLGGRDIHSFTRTQYCAALAAVSQEPVLFPASIAYNIGRGGRGVARQGLA